MYFQFFTGFVFPLRTKSSFGLNPFLFFNELYTLSDIIISPGFAAEHNLEAVDCISNYSIIHLLL